MHELDRVIWRREPDFVLDNPSNLAHLITRQIKDWMEKSDFCFSPDDRMLALAAGQAGPELMIAGSLGFEYSNVTLVDRGFRLGAMGRFHSEFPEVNLVESGLFTFLESSNNRNYSLVTLIGIEYALEQPEALSTLTKLLPNVLQEGGIVAIFPNTVENPKQEWLKGGFKPVFSWTQDELLMYQYNP